MCLWIFIHFVKNYMILYCWRGALVIVGCFDNSIVCYIAQKPRIKWSGIMRYYRTETLRFIWLRRRKWRCGTAPQAVCMFLHLYKYQHLSFTTDFVRKSMQNVILIATVALLPTLSKNPFTLWFYICHLRQKIQTKCYQC